MGAGGGAVPTLEVRVSSEGGRNRLEMFHEGTHVGEYERSIDRHVDAKREEAEGAADLLLAAYRRHGKIAVRWNGATRRKEIRSYREGRTDPGQGGTVLGWIPRAFWTDR